MIVFHSGRRLCVTAETGQQHLIMILCGQRETVLMMIMIDHCMCGSMGVCLTNEKKKTSGVRISPLKPRLACLPYIPNLA